MGLHMTHCSYGCQDYAIRNAKFSTRPANSNRNKSAEQNKQELSIT